MYSHYLQLLTNKKIRLALLGEAPGVAFPLRFSNLKLHTPAFGAMCDEIIEFSPEEINQLLAAVDCAAQQKALDEIFENLIPLRQSNNFDDNITSIFRDLAAIQSKLEGIIFPNFRSYSCELIEESFARCLIEKHDFDLLIIAKQEPNAGQYSWFFEVLTSIEEFKSNIEGDTEVQKL